MRQPPFTDDDSILGVAVPGRMVQFISRERDRGGNGVTIIGIRVVVLDRFLTGSSKGLFHTSAVGYRFS